LVAVSQETIALMIDRREILEAASSFSLLPNIVEKDYVLGWMLAGINAHDELAESWVFKGGTCLKKCYFETYRFSEDLDFTLRNEEHLDEEFLRTAFEEVIAWVTEQSFAAMFLSGQRRGVWMENLEDLLARKRWTRWLFGFLCWPAPS
jgi:predicted nucleotidyltransferase component of viral defense system